MAKYVKILCHLSSVSYTHLVVGCMLLLTAALLAFSYYAKPRQKESISMKDAFIIGLAQACACLLYTSRCV